MDHLFTFAAFCCGLICLAKGEGQTFQNNIYYFHYEDKDLANYTDAEDICNIKHNASLVIIKDEATQSFIEHNILSNETNGSSIYYWAGASSDSGLKWLWADDSELVCNFNVTPNCSADEYSNWVTGSPSGTAMVALALIGYNNASFGKWTDLNQTARNYFICQKGICDGYPCNNSKECIPMNTTYECKCPDGIDCNKTDCDPNPCEHGGNCTSRGDSYECECLPNYTGDDCQTEIDPCDDNLCVNGTCESTGGLNYTCLCVDGYTGTHCDKEKSSGNSVNWAIIGGAIGGGIALIILIVGVILLVRYFRNKEPTPQQPKPLEIVVPHRNANNYTPNPRDLNNRGSFDSDTDDEYATDVPTRNETYTIEADNLLKKCLSMQENNNAPFRIQFQKLLAILASEKGERHYVNTAFHQGEECVFSRITIQPTSGTSAAETQKSGINQFLSMQSPKRNQAAKYWESVWDQSCSIVVSFYSQNGNTEYIPESNTVSTYGNMRVHNTGSQHRAYYVIITYEIEQNDTSGGAYEVSSKHVTEFQWRELGDMTSTLTHPGFHHFVTDLRIITSRSKPPCPLLVHSNGGTAEQSCFLACFALLQHLKKSKLLEIFQTVMEFRLQCDIFMESLDDYILLHKLLAESHVLSLSDQNDKQIGFKMKVLQRKTDGQTGFDNELNTIKQLQRLNIVSKFQLENKEESQYLHIQQTGDATEPCYLRGVMVQGCGIKSTVLAVRAPTWDSLSDFWQCVFYYNVTNIVMVTELFENQTVHSVKYWPDAGKLSFHRGLKVKVESETQVSNLLIKRVISVSSGRSRVNLVQHQYTGWSSDQPPTEKQEIKELVIQLAKLCKAEDESMLVHSGHTMNRAGTFLCLMSLFNRKRQEKMIDVMRTVHNMRKKIPLTADKVEQYSFLYDIVEK